MSILPDFPEAKTTLSWLTPTERRLALRRMAEAVQEPRCSGTSTLGFKSTNSKTYLALQLESRWPGLHLAVTDPKVWWLALTMSVMVMSLSFHAYFPTIIGTLMMATGSAGHGHRHGHGSGVKMVLLLCVPPWVWATGVAVWVNRLVASFFFFFFLYFLGTDELPDSQIGRVRGAGISCPLSSLVS